MDEPITFSIDIAGIVFDDEVDPLRRADEERLVDRFIAWLKEAGSDLVRAKCADIDAMLVSCLSAPSMLRLARAIESVYPEVIPSMPRLHGHLQHLQRASHLARVFTPSNLRALADALREEGAR